MADHVEAAQHLDLIPAPPAEWKRLIILMAVAAVALVAVPSQVRTQLSTSGGSIATDKASGVSAIEFEYTNTGWNTFEVDAIETVINGEDVTVGQSNREAISRNDTATLSFEIPAADCQAINQAIGALDLRLTVRPWGFSRTITPDLSAYQRICD